MVNSLTEKKDAIFALAKNVASVKYEDIPIQAVEIAKMDILDTLGVTIAASGTTPFCKKVVELVKDMGGKEESTIIGYGGKVPSHMAAFANAALAHSLNYGDFHDALAIHIGCSVFPAAIATAERVGKVSGKEFITAYALSMDMESRLARALASKEAPHDWWLDAGWLLPQIFGYFGAAAVAGRLLGLNEEQLINTIGLVYSQVSGTKELLFGGDADKGIYASYPAGAGVISALMAQKGIAGAKSSLEGEAGLYNVYFQGEYDPAPLTSNLGKSFEGVGFHLSPCCSMTHLYIELTLRMVDEHNIRPQDIEAITVFVGEKNQNLCEPLQLKRNPGRMADAQLSLPFVVATAIAKGKPRIEHFTSEGIKDPAVISLSSRVSGQPDKECYLEYGTGLQRAKVEVKLVDGRVLHSEQEGFRYGHPQRPISKEELIGKFKDCASYSVHPLTKDSVESVLQLVDNLEEIEDVSQIIRLVS